MHAKTHMQFQDKFGGKFVARRNDKIVASSPTMKGLFTRLKKDHIPHTKNIVIARIPPKGATCVY